MANTSIGSTTPVTTTATSNPYMNMYQNTNTQSSNPFSFMGTNTMANDVFASKYYNNAPMTQITANQQQVAAQAAPQNRAQSIFQEYMASRANAGATAGLTAPAAQSYSYNTSIPNRGVATTAPTLQDYYKASQIANYFSANNALPYQNSFMQNDLFAQRYC